MTTHRIILVSFLINFIFNSLACQNACSFFFNLNEGTKLEYLHFDKKSDISSKVIYIFEKINQIEGGAKRKLVTLIYDKVNTLTTERSFELICKNGTLELDLLALQAPEITNAFASLKVTKEVVPLLIPDSLMIGQELPNAESNITAITDGIQLPVFTYQINGRSVISEEKIKILGEEIECLKIEYNLDFEAIFKKKLTLTEWYADKIGLVKSKTQNKNGKVIASMELAKVDKT